MQTISLPPAASLVGEVTLPGSKSISNRALLLAALAEGETVISNLLDSDDTRYMLSALTALGIKHAQEGPAHRVRGQGGPLVTDGRQVELDLGLAGTALRPLAAALTLGNGSFLLDGTKRMRERPVAPLVDGLRQLGADISYRGASGYPPLQVTGTGLNAGTARIPGDISSQFLTSLLMAAPLARGQVDVQIEGEQVSKPYLAITVQMMRQFGAVIDHTDFQQFQITPGGYTSPGEFLVEGDASSASYFLAAGAISGAGVTVNGVGEQSVQGDVAFVDVLAAMGARVSRGPTSIRVEPGRLKGIDTDLNAIPDAAMTLAVVALFAEGTTTIRNIYNWRVKETDRLAAMSCELRKLGATVVEGEDFISITPPAKLTPATIDTYGDHRMAMCFALASLGGIQVTINDPDCVSKTYPSFFEQFNALRSAA